MLASPRSAPRARVFRALVRPACSSRSHHGGAFALVFRRAPGTACGALQGFVLLNGVVGPNAQWDLQYTVPPLVVLRVGALVTLSTVLAALMPAYRAARIEVTRALTTE